MACCHERLRKLSGLCDREHLGGHGRRTTRTAVGRNLRRFCPRLRLRRTSGRSRVSVRTGSLGSSKKVRCYWAAARARSARGDAVRLKRTLLTWATVRVSSSKMRRAASDSGAIQLECRGIYTETFPADERPQVRDINSARPGRTDCRALFSLHQEYEY